MLVCGLWVCVRSEWYVGVWFVGVRALGMRTELTVDSDARGAERRRRRQRQRLIQRGRIAAQGPLAQLARDVAASEQQLLAHGMLCCTSSSQSPPSPLSAAGAVEFLRQTPSRCLRGES